MASATRLPPPAGFARPTLRGLLLGTAICIATAPASALTINTTYSDSVNTSANAAVIKSAFQGAVNVYQNMFVNPVTVNIQVGWGEILGSPVSSLGVSGMYGWGSYSYSQLTTMLRATATSTFDQKAYASFPGSSPTGSLSYTLTPALAKAVGAAPATSTGMDGYIGFGSGYGFDFNRADGISGGAYDFMGVALHEISHVLGRVSGLGSSTPSNGLPIDLFRYAGPGVTSFDYNASTYFSADGGATRQANFTNGSGQERDSWALTCGDSYSYAACTGVVNDLTTADKIVMDVLGWNSVAGTTTPVYGGGTTTSSGGSTGGSGGKGKPTKRAVLGEFDIGIADTQQFVTDVPEPASMALFGLALAGLGLARARRAA
jgi:hypothetical protein